MSRRTLFLLFALTLATGCRASGPVGETADIRPTREPALAPETTRDVMAKRAPDALIARDGSTCRVGPDVYASTSVGTLFRCRWLQG